MYTLILEKVICEEETPGWGSDEFGLSLVYSDGVATQPAVFRWYEDDFDSGEFREPKITIYEGELPFRGTLSLLGLEIDSRRKADNLLSDFEVDQTRSAVRRLSFEARAAIYFGATVLIGIFVFIIAGAVSAGLIVLGFLILAVSELILWPIRVTDPDTIAYQIIDYLSVPLTEISTRLVEPTYVPPSESYWINVIESPTFESSTAERISELSFHEIRTFIGDSSRYHIIFRHEWTRLI